MDSFATIVGKEIGNRVSTVDLVVHTKWCSVSMNITVDINLQKNFYVNL